MILIAIELHQIEINKVNVQNIQNIVEEIFNVKWSKLFIYTKLLKGLTKWYWFKQDNEIIGIVGMIFKRQMFYIQVFGIKPQYRQKGLGQASFTRILSHIEDIHLGDTVTLHVKQDNKLAINLYEKNGFEVINSVPDMYGKNKHGLYMMKK